MEFLDYVQLFKKWLWLIVLAGFLAGSVSFLVRRAQPEVYKAQVTISVGGFIEAPNPDSSEIRTGVELAQTYAVLTRTYDVLQAAIEARTLPLTVEDFRDIVNTHIVSNTSLLVITVTYLNPVLAADMANEVAAQLISHSPTNLTPQQQSQIDLATTEIERLNQQLQETRQQLDAVDAQLEITIDQAEFDQLTTQRNVLIEQINQASGTIAQFSNTLASLQERTNSLDIVEQARVPIGPSGLSFMSVTLLGALLGMALAVGLVLLLESLDDTVNTPEETAQALMLPVIGTIPRFGKSADDYPSRLITIHQPGTPASEGYRALRTNLLFSASESGPKSFVVTSPGPEEGKSVTAANLAVVMAAAGLRVLLVDADLRRPRQHAIFDLPNTHGLTTLLLADPMHQLSIEEQEQRVSRDLRACLQDTTVPRLRVITSGFSPANPTEVLGSSLMQRWASRFQMANNVDVIIFDCPPCLMLADSAVLAATINAEVALVLQSGRTRRRAALKAKEQFNQLGVQIVGVVLNHVDPTAQDYGYGYGYSYYYGHDSDENAEVSGSNWRRLLARSGETDLPHGNGNGQSQGNGHV